MTNIHIMPVYKKRFRDCFPNENIHRGLVICAIPTFQELSHDVLAIPWWCL